MNVMTIGSNTSSFFSRSSTANSNTNSINQKMNSLANSVNNDQVVDDTETKKQKMEIPQHQPSISVRYNPLNYSNILNEMGVLKDNKIIKFDKDVICIIIRSPKQWSILVNRLTGDVVTSSMEILSINKLFLKIVSFDSKYFKSDKNIYFLHEVGYWVSFKFRTLKIEPGKTCLLPIR